MGAKNKSVAFIILVSCIINILHNRFYSKVAYKIKSLCLNKICSKFEVDMKKRFLWDFIKGVIPQTATGCQLHTFFMHFSVTNVYIYLSIILLSQNILRFGPFQWYVFWPNYLTKDWTHTYVYHVLWRYLIPFKSYGSISYWLTLA